MPRLVLIGAGVLLAPWALMGALAARLPDGTLKELASFTAAVVHPLACGPITALLGRLGRSPMRPLITSQAGDLERA